MFSAIFGSSHSFFLNFEFLIITKKKDYEQFTCRIEADLLEKVKRTVLDYNLTSVNEFINECIKYSLKNMVIIEEDEDEEESGK